MAKLIIKLIHSVGAVIHGDPLVRDRLKVVFLPNFNVKLGSGSIPRPTFRSRSRWPALKPRARAT